jgi:mRNA interferase RelE/StbE
LGKRIATLDDPRMLGSALAGDHAGYWRWWIGDYRVVARIEDERIVIIVVRVAHRRAVCQ